MKRNHDPLAEILVDLTEKLDAVRTLEELFEWQADLRESGLVGHGQRSGAGARRCVLCPQSAPAWADVLATANGAPMVISLPSGEIAVWDPALQEWSGI